MAVMGVDIGTTSVKATAIDSGGRVLSMVRRAYPLLTPRPGWYELDTAAVAKSVLEAVEGAARRAGRGRVTAVSVSCLGEAFVAVDSRNRPVGNTIVAIDHRAASQAATFAQHLPPDGFFEITGQVLHPMATVLKIMWLLENLPDDARSASLYLGWEDFFATLVGLPPAISPSLAGRTGAYDVRTGNWSERVLDIVGIPREALAPVVASGSVVGEIPSKICTSLSVADGCRLVVGGWDQACNALGAGATAEGVVVNSLGSTDSINATYGIVSTSPCMRSRNLTCTPAAIERSYCTNAFSLSGGNVLEWYRRCIGGRAIDDEAERERYFEHEIAQAFQAPSSVLVLPHFAGSGTPRMDERSLGAVVGLSLATDASQILRGILEGISYEMLANIDALQQCGIPVERIHVSGGGARNAELVQLRCDVYGRPLVQLGIEEAGCLGAAALCLKAMDSSRTLDEIVSMWTGHAEVFTPDPQAVLRHQTRRTLFEQLYPALRAVNDQLASEQGAP